MVARYCTLWRSCDVLDRWVVSHLPLSAPFSPNLLLYAWPYELFKHIATARHIIYFHGIGGMVNCHFKELNLKNCLVRTTL